MTASFNKIELVLIGGLTTMIVGPGTGEIRG
jgi:hypothetical protein